MHTVAQIPRSIGTRRATKEGAYFAYVDGLRAVSIIAVLLFHLDARLLPGGFAGVDVFFVVSGFIISGSLHDRRFYGLLDLFATFYARRFRRIVPAMLFMLIVTSALVVLFVPEGFVLTAEIRRIASAAFLGFSNIRLAFGTNYFFPFAEFNPFTHTWSLAVEEQFYVVFPFLYLMLATRRTANLALIILLILCTGSFAYGWYEPRMAINLGFYSSLARFWEIGSGVLLYAVLARLHLYLAPGLKEIWPVSYAGALLLLGATIVSVPQTYPVPGALLPVGSALCLIAALHGRAPTSIVGRALTVKPMVWIGLASYSLYLWHWPIFSLFQWTIGFSELWQKALALLVAIVMTLVSYRYIETPIRYGDWLKTPRHAVATFLGAIAVLWWGGDRLFASAEQVSLSVVTRHRDDWFGPRTAPMQAGECRVELRWLQLADGGSADELTPLDCNASGAHSLFVVGDSHALGYRPMLVEYARRTGAPVKLYYTPCGFPPLGGCTTINGSIMADVGFRAKLGDVVFLPSLRVPKIS